MSSIRLLIVTSATLALWFHSWIDSQEAGSIQEIVKLAAWLWRRGSLFRSSCAHNLDTLECGGECLVGQVGDHAWRTPEVHRQLHYREFLIGRIVRYFWWSLAVCETCKPCNFQDGYEIV